MSAGEGVTLLVGVSTVAVSCSSPVDGPLLMVIGMEKVSADVKPVVAVIGL